MSFPKSVAAARLAAMAAILAGVAVAQNPDFTSRLIQGKQLRAHDRFAEARTLYQNLLRDLRKDNSHPRFEALVDDNLALDEQDQGRYASAELAFNHGLAVLHGAPDDVVRVTLETHLAELYIAELRPDEAEAIIRRTRAAVKKSTTIDPLALAVLNEDLAVTCIMRHKFSEPAALLRESEALIQNRYGPDDPRLASSLLTYAGLMTAERRYADAVAPAQEAWRILSHTSILIPRPYEASALAVLGVVYYHAGRTQDAEEAARQSVDLAQSSLGPDHPRLGLYLANYATILKTLGRKSESKANFKRASAILRQYPEAGSGGYTVNVAALR